MRPQGRPRKNIAGVTVGVTVTPAVRERLEQLARKEKRSLSNTAAILIERGLAAEERPAGPQK